MDAQMGDTLMRIINALTFRVRVHFLSLTTVPITGTEFMPKDITLKPGEAFDIQGQTPLVGLRLEEIDGDETVIDDANTQDRQYPNSGTTRERKDDSS
jgi:hypothetical protein